MRGTNAGLLAVFSFLLGAVWGYVSFEPPRKPGGAPPEGMPARKTEGANPSTESGPDERPDPAPFRRTLDDARALYGKGRFYDAAMALEGPLARLAGTRDATLGQIRSEALDLREKSHVFFTLTQGLEFSPFVTGEGLKRIRSKDGGTRIVKPSRSEGGETLHYVGSTGTPGSIPYSEVHAIEDATLEDWKREARAYVKAREAEIGEPSALTDYQLARYCLENDLPAEGITFLEAALVKEGAEVLLPALCSQADARDLRYRILLARGDRETAARYLESGGRPGGKRTGIEAPTFEPGETAADGLRSSPEFQRASRLLEEALQHYQRSMPGMPNEDAELEKAKRLFQEAQALFDAMSVQHSDPELDEKRFLVQKHLYDCLKRTKLQ